MQKDPKGLLDQMNKRKPELRDGVPEVMKGFATMLQAAESDGDLDHKTKELVTLGIAIAIRCDYCIAAHVQACLKAGATKQEIVEVCGVAIAMGGGPSYTYATFVLDCVEAFSE